ncbi:hypothetical protein [Pseudomonas sp. 2FE]|uniref:hypothetical protein n=1 Tax=Pseudomonas sp. 2FE TaxID=2502190 RepID=UPI0010F9D663|nr:hypothetical protein [Pseudomonas sp. 2FE]
MEMLIEVVFGVICYRVGFWVLKAITFGRFTGKSSYWFGLICALGALVDRFHCLEDRRECWIGA